MQVENRRQLSLRAILENYQQLFGLPADEIFVNNAAVGLISKICVDAMKTFPDEQYRTGLPSMESIGEKFAQVRLLVGSRIGSPAENIRTKRQLEFQNSAYGVTTRIKRKANFITYFEKMADKNTQKPLHLAEYVTVSQAFLRRNPSFFNNYRTVVGKF